MPWLTKKGISGSDDRVVYILVGPKKYLNQDDDDDGPSARHILSTKAPTLFIHPAVAHRSLSLVEMPGQRVLKRVNDSDATTASEASRGRSRFTSPYERPPTTTDAASSSNQIMTPWGFYVDPEDIHQFDGDGNLLGRPPNSWILYRTWHVSRLKTFFEERGEKPWSQAMCSSSASKAWTRSPDAIKNYFDLVAEREGIEWKKKYPHWTYKPGMKEKYNAKIEDYKKRQRLLAKQQGRPTPRLKKVRQQRAIEPPSEVVALLDLFTHDEQSQAPTGSSPETRSHSVQPSIASTPSGPQRHEDAAAAVQQFTQAYPTFPALHTPDSGPSPPLSLAASPAGTRPSSPAPASAPRAATHEQHSFMLEQAPAPHVHDPMAARPTMASMTGVISPFEDNAPNVPAVPQVRESSNDLKPCPSVVMKPLPQVAQPERSNHALKPWPTIVMEPSSEAEETAPDPAVIEEPALVIPEPDYLNFDLIQYQTAQAGVTDLVPAKNTAHDMFSRFDLAALGTEQPDIFKLEVDASAGTPSLLGGELEIDIGGMADGGYAIGASMYDIPQMDMQQPMQSFAQFSEAMFVSPEQRMHNMMHDLSQVFPGFRLSDVNHGMTLTMNDFHLNTAPYAAQDSGSADVSFHQGAQSQQPVAQGEHEPPVDFAAFEQFIDFNHGCEPDAAGQAFAAPLPQPGYSYTPSTTSANTMSSEHFDTGVAAYLNMKPTSANEQAYAPPQPPPVQIKHSTSATSAAPQEQAPYVPPAGAARSGARRVAGSWKRGYPAASS